MEKTIKPSELKKIFDDVLLIDVREPAEHKSECIEGAYLIPLKNISLENLPSRQGRIVIHCKSGKRSSEACRKLLASDSSLDIYSLEGGIIAWAQEGYNVKKSDKIPLDRQTQIAAGFLIFFGTILGSLINSGFYFIPGFIGAGLMFAGFTGWCGMAKLIAKMPWNN